MAGAGITLNKLLINCRDAFSHAKISPFNEKIGKSHEVYTEKENGEFSRDNYFKCIIG